MRLTAVVLGATLVAAAAAPSLTATTRPGSGFVAAHGRSPLDRAARAAEEIDPGSRNGRELEPVDGREQPPGRRADVTTPSSSEGSPGLGDGPGASRPVGFQRWRDLLFLHWAMPVHAVRPLVPRELDLDLFEGRAYVTLIPFEITEARPVGFPRSFATRFLETNLRTYVRAADGDAGIYFFSLDASSWLAVAGARLLYGLPYFPARMAMRREGARVVYASRRRAGGGPGLDVAWSVGAPAGTAAVGTLDHFLIERYHLFVERAGAIYRARVHHHSYPLHHVAVESVSESLLSAAGLPPPADPPLCHYSTGVDVDIFWLERVDTGNSR